EAANTQALEDLENGATGLVLVMAGSASANGFGLDASAETLVRALEGIQIEAGITLDFNLSPRTPPVLHPFLPPLKNLKLPPDFVDMRASINPIGDFAASGASQQTWSTLSKDFANVIGEMALQGFRGPFVVADGRIIHDAGGSEAQELAFATASAVEYLLPLDL